MSDGIAHGALGEYRKLGEHADSGTAPAPYNTSFGLDLAAQDAQQRCLTAAVEPDDTDTITVAERE